MSTLKFFRECFFKEAAVAMGCDNILLKILRLRYKKLGAFFRIFKASRKLSQKYPFLCSSLKLCTIPVYLKGRTSTNLKVSRCTKPRHCLFCWNRVTCKLYVRMTHKQDKILEYKYFYSEDVILLPKDTPYSEICSTGLRMFAPIWKYRKSEGLKSKLISGVAEHLVVHSFKDENGIRLFKLTLRKIAYCHPDSSFAKTSICCSPRFGVAAIKFCSFPISMVYDGPLRGIKLDEAFRRRRLFRQYGSFYGPD